MPRAMRQDWGWTVSAAKYTQLYTSAINDGRTW